MNPDYFPVLPWHSTASIIDCEKDYLASGRKFVFPMPEIQII
jgi:hypothetical protein